MVVGIVGEDGDSIVFFYTKSGKGIGCLVALVFQLVVGEVDIAEYQGSLVGVVVPTPAEHVGYDPPVDPVVPVHEKIDVFLADGVVAKLVFRR